MMMRNLLASAKALAEALNQDWIINVRSSLSKTCEDMIPLLENR